MLRARARDRDGAIQPEHAAWNERGYGVDAVHAVAVDADGRVASAAAAYSLDP